MKSIQIGIWQPVNENLPTVKKRGIINRQSKPELARYRKIHHLKDYEVYLAINQLPIIQKTTRTPTIRTWSLRRSNFDATLKSSSNFIETVKQSFTITPVIVKLKMESRVKMKIRSSKPSMIFKGRIQSPEISEYIGKPEPGGFEVCRVIMREDKTPPLAQRKRESCTLMQENI